MKLWSISSMVIFGAVVVSIINNNVNTGNSFKNESYYSVLNDECGGYYRDIISSNLELSESNLFSKNCQFIGTNREQALYYFGYDYKKYIKLMLYNDTNDIATRNLLLNNKTHLKINYQYLFLDFDILFNKLNKCQIEEVKYQRQNDKKMKVIQTPLSKATTAQCDDGTFYSTETICQSRCLAKYSDWSCGKTKCIRNGVIVDVYWRCYNEGCFGSNSIVTRLNKNNSVEEILLKNVQPNDLILSDVNEKFSRILQVEHYFDEDGSKILAKMRRLCFDENEDNCIILTYNHLIYINGTDLDNLMPSKSVKISDFVFNAKKKKMIKISSIEDDVPEYQRNVITETGNIIVNDVLASNYIGMNKFDHMKYHQFMSKEN